MRAVVRVWLGFAALGAGLVHLALVIGPPPAVGIPVLLIGIAEFGWGVLAVTRPTLPAPRAARIGALVPLLGWALLLALTAADVMTGLRVLPLLVASLLDLVVAIGITGLRRRPAAERPLTAWRYLIGLAAGASVVIALTLPALAATEAGETVAPGNGIPVAPHGH